MVVNGVGTRETAMDEAGFHPELTDLLADPITRFMMESDRVEMVALVALLKGARNRLGHGPSGRPQRDLAPPCPGP
jgi:hypothetical protein